MHEVYIHMLLRMTLLKVFPEDIVKHIEVYYSGLMMRYRLEQGWEAVHSEISWRSTHLYSCCIHFCDVLECKCYTEYPGYLLRRVDANEWVHGKWLDGKCIHRRENARQFALLSAVINNDESYDDEYDDEYDSPFPRPRGDDNLILNVEDANERTEYPNNGAWWIDRTVDEVGSMNSMLPIVNIGYDAY